MNNNEIVAVFFDFDGTLTYKDTLMPFLKFVSGSRRYYFNLLLLSPVLMAYFLGLLRNDIAKQIVLTRFLAGIEEERLYSLGRKFAETAIPSMLRPELVSLFNDHKKKGHKCVIVSASLDCYLHPWSKEAGFDAALVTRLQVKRGRITGKLSGRNCYGEEKVHRIKVWLNGKSVIKTLAYGDTAGDLAMLNYVEEGYLFYKGKFNKQGMA